MKFAVLLTVFNRREKSIECISSLKLFCPWLDIFVVDDNSTDGTFSDIKNQFPDIYAIKSEGGLFWGHGMRLAWQLASNTCDYDGYIWLNDDVKLFSFGISDMIEVAREMNYEGIVSGALCDSTGAVLYGGKDRNRNLIVPNNTLQDIFYLNGNVVFVPRKIFLKLGSLDPLFHHHGGDYDYGLRARNAGFCVVLSRRFVGETDFNAIKELRGRLAGASLVQRFRRLYSPLGTPPRASFIFRLRHFGFWSALQEFAFLYVINILPDSLFFMVRKAKLGFRARGSKQLYGTVDLVKRSDKTLKP